MKSLSRILKSDQTVTGSLKVKVYQKTDEVPLAPDPDGLKHPPGEEEAERGYALISEAKRRILERARSQAEQSAAAILEDAYAQRDKIVNTAAKQAEHIKEEARKEGYEAGIAEAGTEIASQLSDIRSCVKGIEEQMGQQARELQEQLAGFSLKIAEKILCRTLEEDSAAITELVERAVLSERDKRNIVVHLSDHSLELVEALEKKLEPLREKNDGFLRIKTEDQPPGYVQIETEEGIVDASVFVQLENLKAQLAALDRQT